MPLVLFVAELRCTRKQLRANYVAIADQVKQEAAARESLPLHAVRSVEIKVLREANGRRRVCTVQAAVYFDVEIDPKKP